MLWTSGMIAEASVGTIVSQISLPFASITATTVIAWCTSIPIYLSHFISLLLCGVQRWNVERVVLNVFSRQPPTTGASKIFLLLSFFPIQEPRSSEGELRSGAKSFAISSRTRLSRRFLPAYHRSQLAYAAAGVLSYSVYRARDTRLKREVAIKVLPDEFSQDAERLARFKHEAEVLATLNHSNIAAVYGLEKEGGTTAIVLELVDGDTLAEIIARGPLAVGDALPIARQIADALETAHDRGVVHRDLKPANIKVTPEGKVKVLDFGLAKMLGPERAASSLSMSPTLMSAVPTYAGMILGTAAYMSPEQARGKQVDRRTDIWAFGCVLFEMLT